VKKALKYLSSAILVLAAATLVVLKYYDYVVNPWTRDGQVRANVILITPRVSAPIVHLPVKDNQFVSAGDLLFEIDPRTFEASLDEARARLDQTGDSVRALEKQVEAAEAALDAARANVRQARSAIAQLGATIVRNKAEYERQQELLPKKATSQRSLEAAKALYEVSVEKKTSAEAGLSQALAAQAESQAALAESRAQLGALGKSNPQLRAALAAVRQAELNLEFTRVRAPVDGYVTNLNLRLGSQAVANQPALALVDVNSYWVDGFFKEDDLGKRREPGGGNPDDLSGHPPRRPRGQHRLGDRPKRRQHRC